MMSERERKKEEEEYNTKSSEEEFQRQLQEQKDFEAFQIWRERNKTKWRNVKKKAKR